MLVLMFIISETEGVFVVFIFLFFIHVCVQCHLSVEEAAQLGKTIDIKIGGYLAEPVVI
eukprot:m.83252 g.83252  ORF g.83252 m.83252 type:complete len:59 (+) comp12117_c0_seq3:465-641(+)